MNLVNIAVLGSCVTRDVFNSRFISNYKKFYDCILTQNQSSIISLMSNPIPYDPSKIDNQADDYSKWNVRTELTKEMLPLLKERQPAYIIMDFFGDIHFGILKINDFQYLTNNRWKIMKTTFYKEIQDKVVLEITDQTEEYINLWKSNINKLFEFLRIELPNTKIIVHKTRNTDYYISKDSSIRKLSTSGKMKAENVELLNNLWDHLNNFVIDTYKTESIDMTTKYYLSHENHPWGAFYVHFTKDYYEDFFLKLNNIVLKDYPNLYHTLLVEMSRDHDILAQRSLNELQLKKELEKLNAYQQEVNKKLFTTNNKLNENIKMLNETIEMLNKSFFKRGISRFLKKKL